ncbi:MAG: carbohydrate binding family 9 domain-containing protein [Chitinophagaceae bacterium]
MNIVYQIIIGIYFVLLSKSISAQHSFPNTINAKLINEKISFDGKLNDSAWQSANKISNFTQRELAFGNPATEKTEVAIVYDKLAMYIGVWCYQKDAHIQAKFMQRDFSYEEDDNFKIVLSPFNDKRNGYLFIINPNGARADLLVSGNEDANKDWNGVWDAKTSITNEGWFAEITIPFNSLQFKKENVNNWAINFERNIRFKNEQVLWQGWTRDCSIYCLVNAGTLNGLQNIGYARRFEFKPYLLGAFENKRNQSATFPNKVGGDLNVNLTPTLKLNITANTDFAQVEADRIAVNLSRFSLFYPEKREFF